MSHQYKRIMSFSNPKNKKIMIKNMRGMNDPAFQSNNTLKQYINKKLNLYEESEINSTPKPQSLLKYNEKAIKKKVKNRNTKNNKNLDFTDHSFYSKTQTHNLSHYNNVSLNNLRKKQDKIKEKNKNSFFAFKNNNNVNNNFNKSTKRQTLNKNKKETNNAEIIKPNKFFDIILTPDNNNRNNNETTPLNDLNKIKGIYRRKNILLNKSCKSHSRDYSSIIKKDKEKEIQYKSPQNNNKNNSKLKKEIFNIINHKPLNQTYFKENSKKPKYYNNNLFNNTNNYFKSENNENNNDNLKDLLLKDESFNESECPEPMPYVKKYSDIININKKEKENISESTINIINNFNININKNLNDLNEPVEEKNIPLPVSQIHNKKNKYKNNSKRFIYMNRIKFVKK